ncbi:MAG: peptidoglycan DD-metalloendopeptidase family protein [Prevotella sp.]|nr:peptidoglycan DD-metalloendopeptidase family protein [Bacteroides sp.]MCM1367061.1 peptidoglycan DD-metalloendopeptidase family protein [Prevotella sp.]MCM1437040.1 peptidoglycan DD-metalloendopeptidase family protein [Prevotella sp.]
MGKYMRNVLFHTGILILAISLLSIQDIHAVEKNSGNKSAQSKSKTIKKSTTQKKKSSDRKKTVVITESSAELKKKQESTGREIKETRAKIASNEKSVSQGLADLSRIDADIKVTQKQVTELSTQVNGLDSKINNLQKNITANERELKSMRANYLTAVKKMRLARGKNSKLSFIFSSKSFSQAMRRIRYLREFDAWTERQTRKIKKKNDELKSQHNSLAAAKKEKSVALEKQKKAQNTLQNQFAKQDALVVQLKLQGDQLREHLAKKQAEANSLKNSIAAAIAQEQQREAERRKAEQQRLQAEQQRKAEQDQANDQKPQTKQSSRDIAQINTLEPVKKTDKKDKKHQSDKNKNYQATRQRKADKNKKSEQKLNKTEQKRDDDKIKSKSSDSGRSYAEARKRAPRSTSASNDTGLKEKSTTPVKQPSSSSGFASMKGALPHPVSGAFRITSPFGRHELPELPGVTYDNPGIDAEVSAGASAIAVYPGKVTGIYRLPGYNTVVIVSHGDYYTVYGNLASTAVKNGENVKQGQSIGKVADSDDSNRPSIHFEVWKNRDKLNPSDWIR